MQPSTWFGDLCFGEVGPHVCTVSKLRPPVTTAWDCWFEDQLWLP